MTIKCIETKCPMFYRGEVSNLCKLRPFEYISNTCNRLDDIKSSMERLACEISTLTTELNSLFGLEDWIKDNQ